MKQIIGEIWRSASTDAGRPVLNHVYLDVKKKTLAATNSYLLAVVPCAVEKGDESGLIPAEALKEQAKTGGSLSVGGGIARLVNADRTAKEWPLGQGAFPSVDQMMPDQEAPIRYGFNPDFLQTVGAALGCGKGRAVPMVLHPVHPLKAMKVTGPEGGVGIIMPVRLPNEPQNGSAPSLTDDAQVVTAIKAAYKLIESRRSKKIVAGRFRDVLSAMQEEDN